MDALASRLGRPALIEDRRQNVVAYSRHEESSEEETDEVRRQTILRRQADPAVATWLQQFGIAEARHPLRIPKNQALGMLPRVCVPIWHASVLLGYLWFVDADESMRDEEMELARTSASAFALTLYHQNMLGELASRREAEAVRDLLLSDFDARSRAAQSLVDDGFTSFDAGVLALVVQPVLSSGRRADEAIRVALEQALVGARRRFAPRDSLHLVRSEHGLLLLSHTAARMPAVEQCAVGLVETLRAALAGNEAVESVVVGIGTSRPTLDAALESYEEARHASRIAELSLGYGPVAHWSELGIYRLLTRLSADDVSSAIAHSGLERLLADESAEALVQTLETYLDLAGNAQATAEHLQLHRTTLYYRLGRVEQLAATDLRDGNKRLALHLGLKLARLNGRLKGAIAPAPPAREEPEDATIHKTIHLDTRKVTSESATSSRSPVSRSLTSTTPSASRLPTTTMVGTPISSESANLTPAETARSSSKTRTPAAANSSETIVATSS